MLELNFMGSGLLRNKKNGMEHKDNDNRCIRVLEIDTEVHREQ